MTDASINDRLAREKAFHDDRFTEETRTDQVKYYAAVAKCFEAYRARYTELAEGADVLEYGCALGEFSMALAPLANSVTGIDISDVGVEKANAQAAEKGLSNVSFHAMNAEDMTFEDQRFDLVFGSGILHHLDVDKAYRDLFRILKPGGRVVFVEPLGHNPILNAYRKLTPGARTEDEHPLVREDVEVFGTVFAETDVQFYGLTTLATVPVRSTGLFRPILNMTSAIDKALFRLPGARWMAWFVLLEGRRA